MNSTVPLWAFVTLGVVAPLVTLIGVIITAAATTRREHRNWLYKTKYESYENLFTKYFALVAEYNAFLGRVTVTQQSKEQLAKAASDFKNQSNKTALIASLRVQTCMEYELGVTWTDVLLQLRTAKEGVRAPRPPRDWGGYLKTRDAVRYDLRVRRDPGGWLARRRDRDNVPPRRLAPSLHLSNRLSSLYPIHLGLIGPAPALHRAAAPERGSDQEPLKTVAQQKI